MVSRKLQQVRAVRAANADCLASSNWPAQAPTPNVLFDESGHFVVYAGLLGIKVWFVVLKRLDNSC